MAEDRLRIQAEVTDAYSGPLLKMQGALKQTAALGQQGATALRKDFEGTHGAILKTTGAIQQMAPVLSSFGIGAAGAALSLTGMSSALRDFAGNTQAMSMMARETGVSIDKLRAFGALGERFGVSAQTMTGAVKNFRSNMFELQHRWGEAYTFLQMKNLGGLAEQLIAAPNMEEKLSRLMKGLAGIKDPEIRRRVARMLGAEELGSIAGEIGDKYEAAMAEIAGRIGKTTKAQVDAARQFERSLSDLRENLDGLRTSALTPVIEELNRLVTVLGSPEALSTFNGLLKDIGETARTTRQEFNAIVEAWEKIKGYLPSGSGDERGLGGRLNEAFRRDWGTAPIPRSEAQLQRAIRDKENELAFSEGQFNQGPRAAAKQDDLRKEIGRLTEELRKIRETGGATVQQQSFGGGALGGGLGSSGLIQQAALRSGGGGSSWSNASAMYPPGFSFPRDSSGRILWGQGALSRGGGGGALSHGGGGALSSGGSGPGDVDVGGGFRGRPFGAPAVPRISGPLSGSGGALSGGTASRGRVGRVQQSANAMAVIDELQQAGYGENAISAIVGSMQTESSFKPTAHNDIKGTHDGLWQWDTRRWANVRRWITSKGGNIYDARWQARAWVAEHTAQPGDPIFDNRNTHRGGAILGSNPTLEEAIHGVRMSERFGAGEEGGRAAHARAWLPRVREAMRGGTFAETHRRPEVLADPNDERRRPYDGPEQISPWTRRLPRGPLTRASMDDGVDGEVARLNEERNAPRPGEHFADYLKRRVGEGARFGTDERDTQLRRKRPFYQRLEDDLHDEDVGGAGEDWTSQSYMRGRGPGWKHKASAGDALMSRLYGGQGAAPRETRGRLDIHLHGATANTKVDHKMDGMFKDVNVSRSRQRDDG